MASGFPSAQVRIPVGDLILPHSTCAHTIPLEGKYIRERQRKGAAGVRDATGGKFIRRRNN